VVQGRDRGVSEGLARGQVPRPSKRGEARPQRLSQSTIARTYATVRHFTRWIHNHVAAFPLGCPIDGVKAPEEEESKWKGPSRLEQLRLLTAAQTLRARKGRGMHQGRRDHALIATRLGTGLRVSALLAMDVAQYHGRGFVHVLRKGGHGQKFLPIQKQHREVLDQWLEPRGNVPGPLFSTRSGKRLDRTQAFLILKRVAPQANAHLPPEQHLAVSPHVLRHTLLRKVAHEKGGHDAMARSGHRSDRSLWRSVRPDEPRLAEALDELDERRPRHAAEMRARSWDIPRERHTMPPITDVLRVFRYQRAIRSFTEEAVPDDLIHQVLTAAIHGPSGSNTQPWHVMVVRDPTVKQAISEVYEEARAAGSTPSGGGARQPLAAAPVLIVAYVHTPASGQAGFQTGASIYPSVQNILLAARALGLGSCLTTLHRRRKARIHEILGIPDPIERAAILPLGWPDRDDGPNRRPPLAQCVRYDRWTGPTAEPPRSTSA
jgi:nitroreductase/site-specific recombinase XerC